MIIAVEGIDCSGKSEICPRLAASLNAILYKTPPDYMREEQNIINASATDQDHYRYFLGVVQIASAEIATLAARRNMVIDRYWATTVVYHRAMGVRARLEDFGSIVLPDMTVYLTVSPEVQAERMSNRVMSPGDKRMKGREQLIRRMYDEVLAAQSNVVRVDTSRITPEQVVGLVLKEISLVTSG